MVHYLELIPKEVLATIVMAVVDLEKKKAFVAMIGDGSIYIDGEMHTVDCPGNAPMYLAAFLDRENFKDVWEEALVFSGTYTFNETIAVMTDGIDSFFNKKDNRYINDEEKEMVINQLLKSNSFKNEIGLARICNILQTYNHFEPKDDLSISRLTFISPIDDSIQQTGTED